MLEVEEAQFNILSSVPSIEESETIDIDDALERVLSEDIISLIRVPPADNSAMDGYALNTDDIGNLDLPITVSQRIPAGEAPKPLKKGTAARIFTGAIIPEGANTVVIQENCEISEEASQVRILKKVKANENIRKAGQDIAQDSIVLKSGLKLKAQDLGLIASIGQAQVNVKRKIKVALFCTGNELVAPGKKLKPGQIYNSNRIMLRSLLQSIGCEVIDLEIVSDTIDSTVTAIKKGAQHADLIISSGGVSVGEEDHVKSAVSQIGKLDLWKINIKPGKPLAFGQVESIPFIGLPGNPVSAFVTFLLFVAPALKKRQGEKIKPLQNIHMPSGFDTNRPSARPEYVRVRIKGQCLEKFPNQSSGVLSSVCWADALAVIPANTVVRRGDLLPTYLLTSLMD